MVEPTPGPLSGILVADFSRVLAGPLATMMLGDLGAEVVKVERPGTGDDTRSWGPPWASTGESSYYLSVNRNKRGVVIDLADDAGREEARGLAVQADVLVENFKPGTTDRLGLGYEQLKEANPGLVYASVTGFGSGGGAGLPGYDFLVQAMSGLMSITGQPHGEPTKVGVAVVDVLAGLNLTIGVLAALHERGRSGLGQRVEVSLLSSALAGMVNQTSSVLTAGVVPWRMRNLHPSIAPYEPFATGDEPIAIAVGNDHQYRRLCEAIGAPELADDDRFATNSARVEHRHELHSLIEDRLRAQGRGSWVRTLTDHGVPCGPINTIAQAIEFAETIGLNPRVEVGPPGDEITTISNPIHLSRTPVTYRLRPPRLG